MDQFALWQVIVLAVVQGVTEFLPVSSDGHLAIVEPLIWRSSAPRPHAMDLTIVLHLGTLGSIIVYYWKRILKLLGEDRRVVGLIVLATIPAVALVLVAKLLLDDVFEPLLKSLLLTGLMLPVTGAALLWGQRLGTGRRDYRELRASESLLIGLAQAAAILPGLSRSGTTISAGLSLGLSRSGAATYSFLLAIPALAGAGVYEAFSLVRQGQGLSASPSNLAIGAAVSFIVGLAAIAVLTRVLERGRLNYFAWYCIGLGLLVIAMHFGSRPVAAASMRRLDESRGRSVASYSISETRVRRPMEYWNGLGREGRCSRACRKGLPTTNACEAVFHVAGLLFGDRHLPLHSGGRVPGRGTV